MEYSFQIIEPTDTDWQLIESSYDSTIFHTRKWNVYLDRIGYTPFVVTVLKDGLKIGYFVGQKFWRGISIVASPFEGLGTYTQGLAMLTEISSNERVINRTSNLIQHGNRNRIQPRWKAVPSRPCFDQNSQPRPEQVVAHNHPY